MEHWPSGARDTTEFPALEIQVNADLREHLQKFTQLDGHDWNDYRGQADATDWGVTDQRIRSYRKMYEKLGLVFKDSENKLRLSRLGTGIRSMEGNLEEERDRIFSQVAKTAISILSRYQLRNPSDNYGLPETCDVLPCICIWKAMYNLDNKLHFEEMNRVILRITKMEDLDEAIQKIKHAREQITSYSATSEDVLHDLLGEPVHTDQPTARIAPWYSFAGWGGLIISQNADSEGYRHLTSTSIPAIKEIIQNPPKYFEAQNEEEWFSYYIGDAAITNEYDTDSISDIISAFHQDLAAVGLNYSVEFISRFIASCLAKPFVIFTGLSGSGKTKLSQAFARWISASQTDTPSNFELVSVGADWTSRDNILGYADALDGNKYVRTQALNVILNATNDSMNPYFLLLDEMNLSHVERYFADILSAIESNEQIFLHSDSLARDGVPPTLDGLPKNLFIIGTVNVDETTYMFSPKVLDRANTIEFRVNREDISLYMDSPSQVQVEALSGKGKRFAGAFVAASSLSPNNDALNRSKLKKEVLLFFDILSENGAEFGFRTVKEMARFIYYFELISPSGFAFEKALDAQVLQKVLPKLHGSRKKLEPLLCALAAVCYNEHVWEVGMDQEAILSNEGSLKELATKAIYMDMLEDHPLSVGDDGKYIKNPQAAYLRLSYEKIVRMLKQLEQNGFTSFAEA
ncbi:McrB family protein [Paenibacillus sp. SN-8-1]|uniref:McrB family protein n=1 Tax=Paenibacillus sp. SN-8-1 TaxID=3435409 RepID=UPI003D9A4DCE